MTNASGLARARDLGRLPQLIEDGLGDLAARDGVAVGLAGILVFNNLSK